METGTQDQGREVVSDSMEAAMTRTTDALVEAIRLLPVSSANVPTINKLRDLNVALSAERHEWIAEKKRDREDIMSIIKGGKP